MSFGGSRAPAPIIQQVASEPIIQPAASAPAPKPIPPPAQISGSLQAAKGQMNEAKTLVGGGAGGTVLTSPGGVRMPGTERGDTRNAAMLLYGKTATGA